MYRYFTDEEFRQAKPACSLSDMSPVFMRMLDDARHVAGVPFIVNSAYRSKSYEINEKGREGTSSHTKGVAIDLRCASNFNRLLIVEALIKVGFRRIGIGKNFIHVDFDKDKSPSIWLY